ncbi:UPF0715 family protein [Peribacillus sp. FSL K6-1552]|uniref:UPF0715 family protein n=1 Tax=Peribacillus sp. FSL K6-1552 TaxID=2954514 RepID=UPI004046A4E6
MDKPITSANPPKNFFILFPPFFQLLLFGNIIFRKGKIKTRKISINSYFLKRYITCLVLSAISVSFLTILLTKGISFLDVLTIVFVSSYAFILYLIFASPLQFFLNKNPKKFNILFLIIYLLFSFLLIFILFLFTNNDTGPLFISNYYIVSATTGIVFWVFDSIFLQDETFLKQEF